MTMSTDGIHGDISTFKYPNAYPGNLNCTWKIRGVSQDNVIKLDFNTGSQFSCQKDVLRVYDLGPSSELIPFQPWCSHNLPDFLFSSGSELRVNFNSGTTSNENGFKARFRFIKKNAGKCTINWSRQLYIYRFLLFAFKKLYSRFEYMLRTQ